MDVLGLAPAGAVLSAGGVARVDEALGLGDLAAVLDSSGVSRSSTAS
jgi:hypothetical protein